jgi:hypothetical protein
MTNRRPSKFIVLADNKKSAINMAWEHGGSDFQSRFDKSTGQAQEMKEGALRVGLTSFSSKDYICQLYACMVVDCDWRWRWIDGNSAFG